MPKLLNGKPVVEAMKEKMKKKVQTYEEKGIFPTMGIIRVGSREDDIAYEKAIMKNCESVGIKAVVYEAKEDIQMHDFTNLVKLVNKNDEIHGILIFRPLPEQLDMDTIQNLVDPKKDIDCMNPYNLQKVFEGAEDGFLPCTPEAVVEILKYYEVSLKGSKVAIINRSLVLGKPLAMMLLKENATVEICHSKTVELEKETSRADIVITGAGKPKVFGEKYFSEGSIIVDVGINYIGSKMCGDVNFDEVKEKVSAITPVPGGVGTVTSTILLRHVLEAVGKLKDFT